MRFYLLLFLIYANPTSWACTNTDASLPEKEACIVAQQYRNQKGAPPLILTTELNAVARKFAREMVEKNFFDHSSPEGKSLFDRLMEANIRFLIAGENILQNESTGSGAMKAWIYSPDHRTNLLNSSYRKHGLGEYNGTWVHIFTD